MKTVQDFDLNNKELITKIYIDWFENFLTLSRFAEYYEMNEEDASMLIDAGRLWFNKGK